MCTNFKDLTVESSIIHLLKHIMTHFSLHIPHKMDLQFIWNTFTKVSPSQDEPSCGSSQDEQLSYRLKKILINLMNHHKMTRQTFFLFLV